MCQNFPNVLQPLYCKFLESGDARQCCISIGSPGRSSIGGQTVKVVCGTSILSSVDAPAHKQGTNRAAARPLLALKVDNGVRNVRQHGNNLHTLQDLQPLCATCLPGRACAELCRTSFYRLLMGHQLPLSVTTVPIKANTKCTAKGNAVKSHIFQHQRACGYAGPVWRALERWRSRRCPPVK